MLLIGTSIIETKAVELDVGPIIIMKEDGEMDKVTIILASSLQFLHFI